MTAEELLQIQKPELLFPGDLEKAKKKFRELAREWHPDVNPTNSGLFAHLNTLYKDAIQKLKDGKWEGSGETEVKLNNGSLLKVQHFCKRPFELGQALIGDEHVTYLVSAQFKKLFKETKLKSFPFDNAQMEKQFSPYLPMNFETFKTESGDYGIKIRKDRKLLLLRDVLNHFGGALNSKHVSWIQSRMQNLCCYLSHVGISHNDISPDTLFINPESHSISLLGGWWYARRIGKTLEVVPSRTYNVLPWEARNKKIASEKTDLELIRATSRELLGDLSGKNITVCPHPIKKWVTTIATQGAKADFSGWEKVLNSVGPRKFFEMKLNSDILYPR